MLIKKLALMLSLLAVGSSSAYAAAHQVKYTRKNAALGDTVSINGRDYVIVRIPFKLFTGEKYAAIVPARLDDEGQIHSYVTVFHDTGTFKANTTIDQLPARVFPRDQRTFGVDGEVGTAATLYVYADAAAEVFVKIGSTVVFLMDEVFATTPPGEYETTASLGTAYNAQGVAQWAKYTDPVQQIQALDDLIDYIRVIRIP